MIVELNREDLIKLLSVSSVHYNEINNPLVKRAGYCYSDQYGKATWSNIDDFTDEELYRLYFICKNSWFKIK